MADRLLLDTDVLIDYLRGREEAVAYLEGQSGDLLISTITVAELYAGVHEGKERQILERFLCAFEIVSVDSAIATKGGLYRRDYWSSHGTGLSDALVAATAELYQAQLVTLNERHFPMLVPHIPYES